MRRKLPRSLNLPFTSFCVSSPRHKIFHSSSFSSFFLSLVFQREKHSGNIVWKCLNALREGWTRSLWRGKCHRQLCLCLRSSVRVLTSCLQSIFSFPFTKPKAYTSSG
ncbi:unnamed protein product [Vicia faba]|uniref:Uncharacterized protein n=1 Tax=Vicia faba TaxID=3906 RepID=A0AAV1B7G0_VICFA|nr:unnamed protein product [Vicia faba]